MLWRKLKYDPFHESALLCIQGITISEFSAAHMIIVTQWAVLRKNIKTKCGPMVIQMIDAKVEVRFSLHFTLAGRHIHAGFQLRFPSFLNENIHWRDWRGFLCLFVGFLCCILVKY